MSESIKQRTNAMANHRDATSMRLLLNSVLSDLTLCRGTLLYGFATYNTASLADGAGATTTISVPGAVMGDFVVSVSLGVDLQGITVTGYVSANDVVSVRIQNESTGTLDLASTTIRALVLPYRSPQASIGMLCGAAVYNTASLANAAGATTTIAVTGAALGDYVLVSAPISLQGITVTAYVSATSVVSIRLQNETGGTIDLASTTFRVRVLPNLLFGTVQAVSTIPGILSGTATYDAASLGDAAGATTTVTVTGAVLGDFAIVGHGVDVAGITVTGYVSAADTVSVRLQNESGGTLDLVSATLYARTIPYSVMPLSNSLATIA